jgi:hypothetical protein
MSTSDTGAGASAIRVPIIESAQDHGLPDVLGAGPQVNEGDASIGIRAEPHISPFMPAGRRNAASAQ